VVATSFVVVRVGIMAWGDPKRVRSAVRHKDEHLGYVTVTTYPDRDLTLFPEGSPYAEVAVSDLSEHHVALFQRFKEHWLIHCGTTYVTTDTARALSEAHVQLLATFALEHCGEPTPILAASLKAQIERLLA
jgi:hypothetical protein